MDRGADRGLVESGTGDVATGDVQYDKLDVGGGARSVLSVRMATQMLRVAFVVLLLAAIMDTAATFASAAAILYTSSIYWHALGIVSTFCVVALGFVQPRLVCICIIICA